MAAGRGAHAQILVIVAAFFVVPRIMSIMPDFDPLLAIIGVFGVLAVLQQFGFAMQGGGADDGEDGPRAGGRRQAGRGASREEREAAQPSAKDLLADAERALQQNSWAKVQELAKKVADADPENSRAWELLATAQKWDGKREEAAATVRKARQLYEVDSKGLRALAKELDKKPDSGAMAAECQVKGDQFFGKRQYDLAAECYSKALDALGANGANGAAPLEDKQKQLRLQVARRRAECAQQLQDWNTCRGDATALLEADADDRQALLQRAAANEALEKFKAALDDARRLLALDPKSAAANRIANQCQQALRG